MPQFLFGGREFLLGQDERGFGIWRRGLEYAPPLQTFPGTPEGWRVAWTFFISREPSYVVLSNSTDLTRTGVPGRPPAQLGGFPPGMPAPASNAMATSGGVIGIVGAVLSLIPLLGIVIGLVMGVLAIIFSAIGLGRVDRLAGEGRGMASTGLVLGILTVIFKLIPGVNLL